MLLRNRWASIREAQRTADGFRAEVECFLEEKPDVPAKTGGQTRNYRGLPGVVLVKLLAWVGPESFPSGVEGCIFLFLIFFPPLSCLYH